MTTAITLVTHAGAPEGVDDDHRLAAAIVGAGGEARFATWTDPAVDWSASTITVIRSTWDYHLHPATWARWLERTALLTQLVNPLHLVQWNSDKTYLLDLAARGVPIVPTVLVQEASELLAACGDRGWDDVVVKPTVGASAFGARRFRGPEIAYDGVEHTRRLVANGKALLQPYQPAIEDARERSLVYVDGLFCHAFTKPGFHQGLGDAGLSRHFPLELELALAETVLAALPLDPAFARIDILPANDGPLLMEAELIEPQLALYHDDRTARKLAAVLMLGRERSSRASAGMPRAARS